MARLYRRRRALLQQQRYLLLLATAIAVCTCVGARAQSLLVHELAASTAAARDSTQNDALTDSAVDHVLTLRVDDDNGDNNKFLDKGDDDAVAFTFAAAQLEAARLLSEYDLDDDAFLDATDVDDDDDASDAEVDDDDKELQAPSDDENSSVVKPTAVAAGISDVLHGPKDSALVTADVHLAAEPDPQVAETEANSDDNIVSDQTDDDGVVIVIDVEPLSSAAHDDDAAAIAAVAAAAAADGLDMTEMTITELTVEPDATVLVTSDDEDDAEREDAVAAVAAVVAQEQAAPSIDELRVRIRSVIFPETPVDVTRDTIERNDAADADDNSERVGLEDNDNDRASTDSDADGAECSAASVPELDASDTRLDADQTARQMDAPSEQDTATCERELPAETLGPASSSSVAEPVEPVESVVITAEMDADASDRDDATEALDTIETAVEHVSGVVDPASFVDVTQCVDVSAWTTSSATCEPSAEPDTADVAVSAAYTPYSSFQTVVRDLAIALDLLVLELRLGWRPHVPATLTTAAAGARTRLHTYSSSARTRLHTYSSSARTRLHTYSSSVVEPVADAAHTFRELLAAASTEAIEVAESAQTSGAALSKRLGVTLERSWRKGRVVARTVSTWCIDVWSTYEAVRVAGRNALALALLAGGAAVFGALYRAAAAVPTVALAYVDSLDAVTRAQVKLVSAVLLLLVVYHARVLAWFWLVAIAAGAYYVWSGHVVITIEFK